jgi:hypothetical protein
MNGLTLRMIVMRIRNSSLPYAGLVVLGLIVGFLISYNLTPESTPNHTSTVSGSSGDLNCTTSCVIKEK